MDSSKEGFYIGYLPKAPAALGAWLRTRVLALLLLMLGVAVALVLSMSGFSAANFEFGDLRTFEGSVSVDPYPVLHLQRFGQPVGSNLDSYSSYLLVCEGKFGATEVLLPFAGKSVRLKGTLIHRDGQTMIELLPDSLELGESPTGGPRQVKDFGMHTLRGEIVDSKCFLGVMKPGNLKPHKACAIRCISGGIPPVLMVRDQDELASYYLLVSEEGKAVNADVLEFVAQPVSIKGRVERRGELRFLYADPAQIQLLR